MLAQADKIFINSINNNILNNNGPVWNAAYESYLSSLNSQGLEDWSSEIKSIHQQAASSFADKFVEELNNQKVANILATALNEYIKLALNTPIIVPDPSSGTTLANTAGPVTGVINMKII